MRKNAFLFSMILVMVSCSVENDAVIENKQEPEEQATSSYAEGVMKILFSDEMIQEIEEDLNQGKIVTKSMGLNQALDELGITSMQRLFPYAGEYEERTRREGLHKWYVVRYDSAKSITKASAELGSIDGIEMAIPQRKIKSYAYYTPNDEKFSSQWHLNNSSNPEADIHVMSVWRNYTRGSSNIIVGVIDSGVDLDHIDLAANAIADNGGGSFNFTNNTDVIEPGDHGTHVAGIIAATSNNESGIAGIAGGDAANGEGGVKILSCQIFSDTRNTTGTASAIKYAADNGALICSNSWGYKYDKNENGVIDSDERDAALAAEVDPADKAAIDYFIKYAGCDNDGNQKPDSPMKGGLVVFAAGNENFTNGAPANYDQVIAVGAIESSGAKASYSNYGEWVDIAAPGSSITSTLVSDTYGAMSGTSMACPVVSGVAALILSYYGGEGFTSEDLKERLIGGANYDFFSDNKVIGPLLDAMGAFAYGNDDAPSSVDDFSVDVNSNTVDLEWTVTEDGKDNPAYGTLIVYSKNESDLQNLDISDLPDNVSVIECETKDHSFGDIQSEEIKDLDFEATYYFVLVPYSYNGKYASASTIKSATTGANNPPVIYTGDKTEGISLRAGQSVSLNFSITEPDGHSFTVGYENGSSADSWNGSNNDYILEINGNKAEAGRYTAIITATDSYGLAATYSVSYTILANSAPSITNSIENIIIYGLDNSVELNLSDYFTDLDGDALSFTMTNSSSNIVSSSINASVAKLVSKGYGLTDIMITAIDPRKATVSQTFKVLVRPLGAEMSVYPNPVSTTLYVTAGEEDESTEIRIVSLTGSTVYKETKMVGAFNPATIDMSDVAPGRYTVIAKWGGKEHTQQVVKQ